MMKVNRKTVLTVLLGVAWAGSAVLGGHELLKYENSPGKAGRICSSWPADSKIQLAADRPTLVVLAHPQCPCTHASMDELAQVVARIQNKARVYVLFYTPSGSSRDWENTNLRHIAEEIPGVTVLSDIDGVEAERFGAETSGHTFLFDPSGRLLFNGGITASRGHAGGNAGENAIVSLIDNRSGARAQTFVFGCAIKNRAERRKATLCLQ